MLKWLVNIRVSMCKREFAHRLKLQFLTLSTSIDIVWYALLFHPILCHFLAHDTGERELEKKKKKKFWLREGVPKECYLRVMYFLSDPLEPFLQISGSILINSMIYKCLKIGNFQEMQCVPWSSVSNWIVFYGLRK